MAAWDCTDTYSPAAIEKAPATVAAIPDINMESLLAPELAIPTTRLDMEIVPSLAPSTAARIQPDRPTKWRSSLTCMLGIARPVYLY
jgi:hypothetical protein